MFEHELLKFCLKEVEKKLNWKQSRFWKESDFIKLSQTISEASHISISPHTLKRLFGKIKYKKTHNPQIATKNALSKYLGFSDWNNFVEQNQNKLKEKNENLNTANKEAKISKRLIIYISIIAFTISLLLFFYNRNLNNLDYRTENYSFILKDSIGTVPYTVPITYDFSKTSSDSIYIDFNFKHPFLGAQNMKPKKNGSVANFSYQIPGYYHITLKKGENTLSRKNVLAMSTDWDSYFEYESERGKFWLDNEIEQLQDSLGYLYFSPKYLLSQGFDNSKVFYITHRLFKKFKIDGDNFEFETKFKNSRAQGGISCYDFIIRLICEKNQNYLNLMESGCSQYTAIKIGELVLNGSQENLTTFKLDPEQWNLLKIVVKEKKIEVFLNKKMIFKGDYKNSNGNIVGIENVFKGSGMLDYIRLKDLKTLNEFFDDFK